jgi:uncharacterized protein (DUF1697 family)
MPRYAAFLRGVMPTNVKMPELKRAFEAAGFTDVRTVLSSGNVVFTARTASNAALAKKAEAAMRRELGKAFTTLVRPVEALKALVASDPYRGSRVDPKAKRIVTFLGEAPNSAVKLPVEQDGARIVRMKGGEVFSAYLPTPRGPVFMTLLERTFGKEQTTRTWQTIEKVIKSEP